MSLADVVPGAEPGVRLDGVSVEIPDGESIIHRWVGMLRGDSGREAVVLAVTGECLVFRSEGGRSGVLRHKHVSAVEARMRADVGYDGVDWRAVVGGGAALAALSFLGAVLVPWSSLALVLVVVAVAGVWLIEHGWHNRETYDGFERIEAEVEHVTVRSADGTTREFVFSGDEGVGERLVALVRET